MRYLIAILLFVAAYAYGEVKMLGNLEEDSVLVYAIDPGNCKVYGTVRYTRPTEERGLIVIESIICGDSIFSDGFDGHPTGTE